MMTPPSIPTSTNERAIMFISTEQHLAGKVIREKAAGVSADRPRRFAEKSKSFVVLPTSPLKERGGIRFGHFEWCS